MAVTRGGRPKVNSASRMTVSAYMYSETTPFLPPFLVSASTEMLVISEPVPDVVGIRMQGREGFGTRLMPKYLSMGPSLESSTEAAFVVSRAEPPPKPMITSAPKALASSVQCWMESMLGSSWASAYSFHSMPPAVRASSRGFWTPILARPGSVTMNALEPLRFFTSLAASLIAPRPCTIFLTV